jgi:DNA polymerase/3'-5' exonuclease PolX
MLETPDYRRRVEVIEEISFVVESDDITSTIERFHRFGGRTPLLISDNHEAVFAVSAGILVRLRETSQDGWGLSLVACTGSKAHFEKLSAVTGPWSSLRAAGALAQRNRFL